MVKKGKTLNKVIYHWILHSFDSKLMIENFDKSLSKAVCETCFVLM